MNLLKHIPLALLAFGLIFSISISYSYGQCSPCIQGNIIAKCPGPLIVSYSAGTSKSAGCKIKWEVTNGTLIHQTTEGTSIGPLPWNDLKTINVRWDDTHKAGKLKITVTDCTDTPSNGTNEKTIPITSLTGQTLPNLVVTSGGSGTSVSYCTTSFGVRIGNGSPIYVGIDQNPSAGTGKTPDFYDWLVPSGWTINGNTSNGSTRISTLVKTATIGTNGDGCETDEIRVRARYLGCGAPTTISKDQKMTITRTSIGTLTTDKTTVKCGAKEFVLVTMPVIPCSTSSTIIQTPPGWSFVSMWGTGYYYLSNGQNEGTFRSRTTLNCGSTIDHTVSVGLSIPSVGSMTGPTEICNNNAITYAVPSSGFPNEAFTWSVSPNLEIIGSNIGPSVSIKAISVSSNSGPGWIKVTTCDNRSNQKNVHVGTPRHIDIHAMVDPSSPGATFPYDALCHAADNFVTASYPFAVNSFYFSLYSGSAWVQGVDNQTTRVHPYNNFGTVALSVTATNSCGTSLPVTHDFTVNSCGWSLKAGPNPTSDYLNISFKEESDQLGILSDELGEEVEVILYNSSQVPVKRSKTTNIQTQLDVRDLDPGIYFLKVFRGEEVEVKKIVISGN